MVPIADMTGYNAKMKKGFLEKTFFLKKIDANVYVDFGCADGSMIKFMNTLFPEYDYIGYDIDPTMIKLARENNKENTVAFFPFRYGFTEKAIEKNSKNWDCKNGSDSEFGHSRNLFLCL